MRIACVWVAHLPAQVEARKDHTLAERPLIIGGKPWDRTKVFDCSQKAESYGVSIGMPLRQAEQLCPEAIFLKPDHRAYEGAQRILKETLLGFSPMVEMAGAGLGYAEISGLDHLCGPEMEAALAIAREVGRALDLKPQIGVAANKFTARLASSTANGQGAVVIPAGKERRFLADFPLWYLPCDEDVWECLHRLGIHTLGELVRLGKNAVVGRFGRGLASLYDLARGLDPSPLVPERVQPCIERRTRFDEGVGDRQQLAVALSSLVEEAFKELEGMRRLCGGLRVEVATVSNGTVGKSLHLKSPSGSPGDMVRLAQGLLEKLELGGEIEEMRLTLSPLRGLGEGATQRGLFDFRGQRTDSMDKVIRTLQERWGEGVLQPASMVEPPEPLPVEVVVGEGEVPQVLRWSGKTRRVVAITEHWRVASDWWRREVVRYYYQILPSGDLMAVAYRDGIGGGWYLEERTIAA